MGRTSRNGHDSRALRVLGLLAVLLGLLAMHSLASSHHAPAAAAGHSAAGYPVHEPGGARDHHDVDAVAAAQQSSELPASPVGSCAQDCPGAVFALCVAVLAATTTLTAAVVVLRGRRRRAAIGNPAAAVVRVPASARCAPPPDPVRELCVSRT